MNIERTNSRSLRPRALVGLLLIPLLIAGGLLMGNWGSSARSRDVQAAVVNLDVPVTVKGQYTPLGRQLTAALVDSKREANLTWVLATAEGAQKGLASGQYVASVTIPADFSAKATSFSGAAGAAQKAVVEVQTSRVAALADATLGKVVAREAVDALNSTLTSSYLEQVYLGFNEMGDQFATVADGAKQLSDGVSKYTKGVAQLADGASQIDDGQGKLTNGLDTMYTQTSVLPSALRQLADGLGIIKAKTKPMPPKVKLLADGVKQYVGNVNPILETVIGILDAHPELLTAIDALSAHADELQTALDDAKAAIAQIQQLAGLTPDKLADKVPESLSCERALASVKLPDGFDQTTLCALYYQGLAAGIDQANQRLEKANADGSLDTAMKQAQGVADAAKDIQADGAASLVTKLKMAKSGGDQLVDGTKELADGLPALVKGIGQAADGAKQLADKMPALVDGIGQSADGSRKLWDATTMLSDGLGQAVDGSPKLTDGAKQLADGLAKGQSQVPHYSESDRSNLSSVVAGPIDTTALVGTASFDAGWASVLLVLAVWLGALATFSVLKALAGWLRESAKPPARVLVEMLVPGVAIVGVQGVIVATIGEIALQLPPAQIAAIVAILIVAGAAFALLNQALVAWLRGAGRVVAVAFAVLASVDLVTRATPGWFGVLRALSPLSPAVDAIRAVVTESSGVTLNVAGVVAWLVIGALAAALAVLRARTTTFAALAATQVGRYALT